MKTSIHNRNNSTRRKQLFLYMAMITFLLMPFHALSSANQTVWAAEQSFQLDKRLFDPSEKVSLSYKGASSHGKDWIGIYRDDRVVGVDTSNIWGYMKSGDGRLQLNNLPAGKYTAYYLLNDSYTIVQQETFEVGKSVAVTNISIDQQNIVMLKGKQTTVSATITPSNATDKTVTFESSDPAIVSIGAAEQQSAVLQAHLVGEATITVRTATGSHVGTTKVTVTAPPSLTEIIESVETKLATAQEGNDDGYYAIGAKSALQTALELAEQIVSDDDATEGQLNEARAQLELALAEFTAKLIRADINLDGKHTIADLAMVAKAFEQQQAGQAWEAAADVNHDGVIDSVDYQIVARAMLLSTN